MSILEFTDKNNITTLWDVISDEDVFKFLSKEIQNNVYQTFLNNISSFYETERSKNTNLIEQNKKYIILILNYIKNTFPEKMPNKIKILTDSNVKEMITYEDIQNYRQSQFERDLINHQDDFNKSMSIPIPEVPEFTDKYVDPPINEIDKILKEMTEKRNYEIEQINQKAANANIDWLHPIETSVKSEKFIDSELKKNVTWGNNQEINESDFDDNFILNKLKKNPSNPAITLTESNTINTSEQLQQFQQKLDSLSNKLDMILDLLNKNNLINNLINN